MKNQQTTEITDRTDPIAPEQIVLDDAINEEEILKQAEKIKEDQVRKTGEEINAILAKYDTTLIVVPQPINNDYKNGVSFQINVVKK